MHDDQEYHFPFTDIGLVQQVRDQIPVSKQRRLDIYDKLAQSD